MYCLRVFIVVLQDFTTMFTMIILVYTMKCIPRFILICFCVSELHAHLYPYHIVWPEAVYLYKNYNVFYMLISSEL